MKHSLYIVFFLLLTGILFPVVAMGDIDDVYYWPGMTSKQAPVEQRVPTAELPADSLGYQQVPRASVSTAQPINTEVVLDQDTVVKVVVHK